MTNHHAGSPLLHHEGIVAPTAALWDGAPFSAVPSGDRTGTAPAVRTRGSAAGEFLYCLIDLPLSVVLFGLTVTLLAAGAGTAVVYVGVAILAGGLLLARAGGAARRSLSASLLAHPVADPAPVRPRRPGWWGGLVGVLADGPAWRAVLYHLLSIVLGPLRFAVAVALYAAGLGGVTYPLWYHWRPAQQASDGTWHHGSMWGPDRYVDTLPTIAVQWVICAGVLALAPVVVRLLLDVERALISGLLGAGGP